MSRISSIARMFNTMFATLIIANIAIAEIPPKMTYQGYLEDTSGNPVQDAAKGFTFRIYDLNIGGSMLWESGIVLIPVDSGLFSHVLGENVPLPDSLVNYDSLWLGITVGLDPETTPRIEMTSVGFSYKSLVSSHAVTADTAQVALNKTVDASELTSGELSSDFFSAYNDLAVEGKIGTESSKVAAGDHAHNLQGSVVYSDSAVYADTAAVILGSNIYRRLALGSSDSTTGTAWVVVGDTLKVSANAIQHNINVVLSVRSDIIVGGGTSARGGCSYRILIGEAGSEVTKEERRYAFADESQAGGTRYVYQHSIAMFYEPSLDELNNGFNVVVEMSTESTGPPPSPPKSVLLKAEVFGI